MAVFGCIQPGDAPVYQFQQVGPEKWTLPLSVLRSDQLVVFLTGAQPCPDGKGVAVYLSRAEEQAFEYLGCLTNQKPSAVFRVPVSFIDVASPVGLVLGLSLEPLDSLSNIENSGAVAQQSAARALTHTEIARKIAEDVSVFLGSFVKQQGSTDYLVVPADCINRWMEKI
eukprot:gene18459-28487_t